jgi:transcription-repair coupling factor (superfamily II helicase)
MTAEFQQKAVADLRNMASIYARLGATDKESELKALAQDMESRFAQTNVESESANLDVTK